MAVTTVRLPSRIRGERRPRVSLETGWGLALVLPYAVFFLLFVVWPVLYGLWLGSSPRSYATLLADPLFLRTLVNTVVFLGVGINLKLLLALLLSGFFANTRPWIRWLSVVFILPWAVPSIPTILSFRSVITVHFWKSLPFWTLILLAGRMAIPADLYEAARIDGATPLQQFTHVTWPHLRNLYITSTLLSTIWSLGDFNSVYLLTGGGPAELTHVLATLGIRYAFNLQELGLGVATVMVALPILVPLVILLVRRLGKGAEA